MLAHGPRKALSMIVLAGSLYLVSTIAFGLVAGAIGIRLILLSRRTGQTPERFLGWGLLLTAGLGYMPMILGLVARNARPDLPAAPFTAIVGAGWVFHNLGVICMLVFVVRVFRSESGTARLLAGAMGVALWIGWGLFVAQGGLVDGIPRGGYWLAFATIGTYPFWSAFESFRYFGLMRKRLALGLAEPLLVDRFRLWGVASVCAAASIWIVNIPTFVGMDVQTAQSSGLTALCMLVTAAFGTATVCTYWLTFFTPGWYRSRFTARAA